MGRGILGRPGLVRSAGDPGSGLDSAAAWAVRPFAIGRRYTRRRARACSRSRAARPASGSPPAKPGPAPTPGPPRPPGPPGPSPHSTASLHLPPPSGGQCRLALRSDRGGGGSAPGAATARRPAPRRHPGRRAARAGRRAQRRRALDHPARLVARLRDPRPGRTLALNDAASICVRRLSRIPQLGTNASDQIAASAAATACSAVSAATTPGARHPLAPVERPAAQRDDGAAERPRVADLRERPPLAADRDHDLAGGDHGEVAGVADRRSRRRGCSTRFASAIELPGTIPITPPPASAAPREAASITPGPPPQTTVTPASANRRPTSSASPAELRSQLTTAGADDRNLTSSASSSRRLHRPHQLQRARLVQRFVEVAALRALHAGGAAVSQGHSAISRSASPSRRSNCS